MKKFAYVFCYFTISGFLLVVSLPASAQDDPDFDHMVGFGCFYGGEPTEPVIKFQKWIHRKNYNAISQALRSTWLADRYLAVVVLERFDSLGTYEVTSEERRLMNDIRNSSDLVPACSGCVEVGVMPLKDAFSRFATEKKYWLDRHVHVKPTQ